MTVFDLPSVADLIRSALAEDLGRGDLTTRLTIDAAAQASAEIVAQEEGLLAGLPLVERVFAVLEPGGVSVGAALQDGAELARGVVVAKLSGSAVALLSGERVALNFLQHLCGVATLTRRYVRAVAGTRARIVDTRKTLPGFRVLDKYAVRVGGGHNHRMGLDDGILIKDNHIAAAGGVAAAVRRARAGAPHTQRVEVECADLAEVDEALAAGAAVILLDNMNIDQLRAAVRHIDGRAQIEASGGVNLETVRAIAETGVDLISVGALTHSAPAVDLSMRMRLSR